MNQQIKQGTNSPPTRYQLNLVGTNRNFYTTNEVAKILGVTKQAVEKWRKQNWFIEDILDHNGIYWYSAERVKQLENVYHPNWTRSGYQEAPTFKQHLENLPEEILALPRFLPTRKDNFKAPAAKEWQNPKNQRLYSELKGIRGFVAATDNDDSLAFFDFDHALDDNGNFVNGKAECWFNLLRGGKFYCELSQSGHGLHMFARLTKGKFDKLNSKIYFDDAKTSFLEIFYRTTKFCLCTGNLFRCPPNAPIAHGDAADALFQAVLDEIAKTSKKAPESSTTPATLIYQSANSRDYNLFRANKMLDCIIPADLADSNWLAVISAAKNIGIPYSDVDAWCKRDTKRYNEEENLSRWNSTTDPSFDIETLHGIAKRFGYSEKDTLREWYQLNPEFSNKIIHKPAPMNDADAEENFSWTQNKIKSCPVNLRLPDNFIFDKNGVVLVVPPKNDKQDIKYIRAAETPIIPTKIFREPQKNNFSYEIAILFRGKWRTAEVDGRALADPKAIIALADKGALLLEPKIICRFLNKVIALNPDLAEIKAYAQTGWTDDTFTTFAYPNNGDCILRRVGFDFNKELATRGNAELWKEKFLEVDKLGGAIAHAYIGTALAAVLARPLNIMNPQTHLHGTSDSGKTALQKFAASIFGNPIKLKRTFAATSKNRQLVSAAFCDLPTFYDELETIQGKAAEERLSNDVYNFADGKGDQANKRDGTARETFDFGGARLTTGERPILKQHDLRGAYKRLLQLDISQPLFDNDFATNLHIFSESNFGHFGRQWIQFVTEHMPEIQEKYQQRLSKYGDGTRKNYDATQLKTVTAALTAYSFFKVMLGVIPEFNYGGECLDDCAEVIDTLPARADLDDTARALKALESFVASHEKYFLHGAKDTNGDEMTFTFSSETYGKIFGSGAVAFFPTILTKILEEELRFASADKLINEWFQQGILLADDGRKTKIVRINKKTYRVYFFKAGTLTCSGDTEGDSEAHSKFADFGIVK